MSISDSHQENVFEFIASEESFLLSHMGPPKNAIKSLILVPILRN